LETETSLGDLKPEYERVRYPHKQSLDTVDLNKHIFGTVQKPEEVPLEVEGHQAEESEEELVGENTTPSRPKTRHRSRAKKPNLGWFKTLFDEQDAKME
jgi:hypothetical protein